MPLPRIFGEYAVVAEPEVRFSDGGKAWVKIRGVAKDRVRDSNGNWSDGKALFIDIVVFNDHIAESVGKGDTVVIEGKLQPADWEKDGQTVKDFRIVADTFGVSTRWQPAKTPQMLNSTDSNIASTQETLGGTPVADDTPPF